jgi:hypothetical protein
MDFYNMIDSATLDDFTVEKSESGTLYKHKEFMCGAVIFDDMPGRDDPEILLKEIKAAIIRGFEAAKK